MSSEDALIKALEILSQHSLMDYNEALTSLLMYVRNLIQFGNQEKYHRIRINNIHFRERLYRLEGAHEALNAIGYRKGEDDGKKDSYWLARDAELSDEEWLKELQSYEAQLVKAQENCKKEFALLPTRLDNTHKYTSVVGVAHHNEKGKRQTNEDDEIVVDAFCGDPKQIYLGLYDGHGGRQTVEYVVKALHLLLESKLKRFPDTPPAEAFTDAYVLCDGHVRRTDILQSGTTAVSVIMRDDEVEEKGTKRKARMLHCANVGDSRAVLCRDRQADRLTVDHKPSLDEERERIKKAGGFVGQGNRVNGILAISRALGDHTLKSHDAVTAKPYCRSIELTDEDDYLILACDGLWDVMTDQQACDYVYSRMEQPADDTVFPPETAINYRLNIVAEEMVRKALDLGSTDNVTVMLVKLR